MKTLWALRCFRLYISFPNPLTILPVAFCLHKCLSLSHFLQALTLHAVRMDCSAPPTFFRFINFLTLSLNSFLLCHSFSLPDSLPSPSQQFHLFAFCLPIYPSSLLSNPPPIHPSACQSAVHLCACFVSGTGPGTRDTEMKQLIAALKNKTAWRGRAE